MGKCSSMILLKSVSLWTSFKAAKQISTLQLSAILQKGEVICNHRESSRLIMEPPQLLCSLISDMTRYLFLILLPLLLLVLLTPISARVCSQRDNICFIYKALRLQTSQFYQYSSKSSLYSGYSSSVGNLGEGCLVNYNEIDADTSIFSFSFSFSFSFWRSRWSWERDSVQFRKLSLSKACGFFLMVYCKSSNLLVVAANSDCMVPSKGSSMGCCWGGLELIIMLWMVQLRLLSFLRLIGCFDSIICDSTMSIEDQLPSSAGRRFVFIEKFLDFMVASEKLEELFNAFFIFTALSYCLTRDGESLMFFFSSLSFQTNLAPRCNSSKADRTAFSTSFILFLISRQQSSNCFLSMRLFLREVIRCCTSASIFFICSWTDFACRCNSDSDKEGASMLLGYSCLRLSFPLMRLIINCTNNLSLSKSSQRGRFSWFLTSNFLNHRHKYLTSSRRSLEQKLGMSLISAFLMRSIILNKPTGRFSASFTGKSRSKAHTSQMTQPSDHTSALNPQSYESTISGAIYDGVPAEVLQC